MRSPAAAIAWEFRRHHRLGLVGVAAGLVILAAGRGAVYLWGRELVLRSPENVAIVIAVPLSTICTYFLAVFTYGLSGDVAARESMYPRRMLALPVSTAALAGWPMALGTAALLLLWIIARPLLLWPPSMPAPVLWPGALAVVELAWAQALLWLPYGARGARVVVTMLLMAAINAIVLIQLRFKVPELTVLLFLAPQVPLAYLVARHAVRRARRGEVPDWTVRLPGARVGAGTHRLPAFATAARAQAWFEWRQHGRTLPALVAMVLPFELLLLPAVGESTALVYEILTFVLLTPAVLSVFVGASTAMRSSGGSGAPAFLLARPMSDAALIAAKLGMAFRSTLVAWLLVLVAIPVALAWSGTWRLAVEGARHVSDNFGTPRAVVFLLLVLAGCMAATWRQLVQSLCIGLTGRDRFIKGSVFAGIVAVSLVLLVAAWIEEEHLVGAALNAFPLVLAGIAALKMAVAIPVVLRLHRGRVVSDRVLVVGAAAWCAAVFALYGLFRWMLDSPHFPAYFLTLVAILAIPLARLSAAPLALAWSRHR